MNVTEELEEILLKFYNKNPEQHICDITDTFMILAACFLVWGRFTRSRKRNISSDGAKLPMNFERNIIVQILTDILKPNITQFS